ncbi:MAG: hypothetical protein K0Q69_832 [Devosia sp.]|jgi:hypothetical protein|nr:hypothetical protein [Devosia sp.]
MSSAFYPSDEYDSSELELELERERAQRRRPWLQAPGRDDDDDPPAAARALRPKAPALDLAKAA